MNCLQCGWLMVETGFVNTDFGTFFECRRCEICIKKYPDKSEYWRNDRNSWRIVPNGCLLILEWKKV